MTTQRPIPGWRPLRGSRLLLERCSGVADCVLGLEDMTGALRGVDEPVHQGEGEQAVGEAHLDATINPILGHPAELQVYEAWQCEDQIVGVHDAHKRALGVQLSLQFKQGNVAAGEDAVSLLLKKGAQSRVSRFDAPLPQARPARDGGPSPLRL